MKKILLIVASLLVSGPSKATLWHFINLLQESDQGFGFSSLHAGGDDTPMSGAILAKVSSASGTCDDVAGEFNFKLVIDSAIDTSMDTPTPTGNLLFDGGGRLAANSVPDYSGLDNLAAASSIGFPADNNQFGFLQDLDCGGCHGADCPNCFMPQGGA